MKSKVEVLYFEQDDKYAATKLSLIQILQYVNVNGNPDPLCDFSDWSNCAVRNIIDGINNYPMDVIEWMYLLLRRNNCHLSNNPLKGLYEHIEKRKGKTMSDEKTTTAKLKTVESLVINIDAGRTGDNIPVHLVKSIGNIKIYVPISDKGNDEVRLFFVLNGDVVQVMDLSVNDTSPIFEFSEIDEIY